MPAFTYVAKDKAGKKVNGILTAENRMQATQQLQKKGLQIQSLNVQVSTRGAPSPRTKVKSAELLVFTRQLSTMINAGLPLLQGLDILADQTEDPRFMAVLQTVAADVETGETFSDALRHFPRAFPELFVSMIRAGEAGGNLGDTLLQLADYIEASEDLKRRIKSAMMYPVIAFSMILLIATGLIVFVVPQFAKIFAGFGADLPKPTMILMGISYTLRSWKALIVVGVIIAIIMGIRMYGRTPIGKLHLDAIKLRLPVFGKLLRKVAISRFTRTLSTLTKSGVPILQALEITERTAGNEVFARVVRAAGEGVQNGETLAEPLERSNEFPPMVTRMIGAGEKTGALDDMLQKVSDFYDSEVQASVDGLTSLIEPILIMMMGIVVGSIVIALFMPIIMLSSLASK